MSVKIVNVLYPRRNVARDDEIERLDDVMLHAGRVIISGCHYKLTLMGPPEYERAYPTLADPTPRGCGSVTYRWLMRPCP